jgi:polysaccharide export outer membrane protein
MGPRRRRCVSLSIDAFRGLVGVSCLASASLGCADLSGPKGLVPPAELAVASAETYRVGPSDQLTVRVLPDPPIERKVVVRPDGYFSMDLIGDVEASGRTTAEIATDVEGRISKYRQSPSVAVALDLPASTVVAVLGEVNSRSMFPLDRPMHLSEAIAKAGGPSELAATSRIRVIRREEGQTVRYDADLDRIQRGDTSTDLIVREGDLIYVPAAVPVVAGYKIRRALYPFTALFQTIAGPLLGLALGR